MKSIVVGLLLVISFNVYAAACPKVTGNFLCDKEAEYPFRFGQREISIYKQENIDAYVLKVGELDAIFEVDRWNQGRSTDGQVDEQIRTIAKCSEEKLTLSSESKEILGDDQIEMLHEFEISPIENGIHVSVVIDSEEFSAFDCKFL